MKIALLQLNYTVGDIGGNLKKIVAEVQKIGRKVDLFVTSELALTGYPPKDLILNQSFVDEAGKKLRESAKIIKHQPPLLIGTVTKNPSKAGKPLYNSAVLLQQGEITQKFHKTLLPAYDVFDEGRYFEPGAEAKIFLLNGKKMGVTICEDIWNDTNYIHRMRYHNNPLKIFNRDKADIILNLSASPFSLGKQLTREKMLSQISRKYGISLCYINQVGANDELIFDGRSCVFDEDGKLIIRAKAYQEDVLLLDSNRESVSIAKDNLGEESEVFRALVLGIKDYAAKCGFSKAVIGLSGGVDSSLVALLACRALGKENILGVLMPSAYSSPGSIIDAKELAKNLGIKTLILPISDIFTSYNSSLKAILSGSRIDITQENIQARIRGNILMALSNNSQSLVLSTGNKSELAVGYCTIYGDLSGGLAVISDVPKTLVYRLALWVNKEFDNIIPETIIVKEPSAELKFDQKDSDTLPSYGILDRILELIIEQHQGLSQVVKHGFDRKVVKKVLQMVHLGEFKRKQAPMGLKITDRAFGSGWKMPIAKKIEV